MAAILSNKSLDSHVMEKRRFHYKCGNMWALSSSEYLSLPAMD